MSDKPYVWKEAWDRVEAPVRYTTARFFSPVIRPFAARRSARSVGQFSATGVLRAATVKSPKSAGEPVYSMEGTVPEETTVKVPFPAMLVAISFKAASSASLCWEVSRERSITTVMSHT